MKTDHSAAIRAIWDVLLIRRKQQAEMARMAMSEPEESIEAQEWARRSELVRIEGDALAASLQALERLEEAGEGAG